MRVLYQNTTAANLSTATRWKLRVESVEWRCQITYIWLFDKNQHADVSRQPAVNVNVEPPAFACAETPPLRVGQSDSGRAEAHGLLGEAGDSDLVRARPFRRAGIGERERCASAKRDAAAVLADRQNAKAVRRAVRHRQRTAVEGVGT